MILISGTDSKIAHLSTDGQNSICQTRLGRDTITGQSLGFVGATKRCKLCPSEEFINYFDALRRGIAYEDDRDLIFKKEYS